MLNISKPDNGNKNMTAATMGSVPHIQGAGGGHCLNVIVQEPDQASLVHEAKFPLLGDEMSFWYMRSASYSWCLLLSSPFRQEDTLQSVYLVVAEVHFASCSKFGNVPMKGSLIANHWGSPKMGVRPNSGMWFYFLWYLGEPIVVI